MSRQASDELYIELGYYTPENYHVYIASAQVISGFYIDSDYIDPDYFQGSTVFASLVCELTQVVGQTVEAVGAVVAEFAQVATVGQLHNAVIIVDALFASSLTAQAKINSTAVLHTVADLTATASKRTASESLLEFFAALNAQAAVTREANAAFEAKFLLGTLPDPAAGTNTARLRDAESSLAVLFELTATVDTIRDSASSLTSTVSLAADAEIVKFVPAEANLAAEFAQATFPIIYALRPNPYQRPINLDSAPYTFNSTVVRYGTHSLETFFNGRENTAISTEIIPAANENYVIEFWVNLQNSSLLGATVQPGFLAYGDSLNNDNIAGMGGLGWAFGISPSINQFGSSVISKLQFRFIYAGTTFTLLDNTAFSTRLSNASSQTAGWIHLAFTIDNANARLFVNNSGQESVTLPGSGTISLPTERRIYFGNRQQTSNIARSIRYDSLRIARGTAEIQGFTQPPQSSVNTVLLYNFDNNDLDQTAILFTDSLSFASTTALSASSTVDYSLTQELNATASVTADATKSVETSATLQSQGFVVAVAGQRLDDVADLVSAFNLSVSAGKLASAQSSVSATATLTVEFDIRQLADAQLSSASTLSATVQAIISRSASLISSFTVPLVKVDIPSLVLFSGSSISSTGANLFRQIDDRAIPDNDPTLHNVGWHPVYVNFWIKISDDIAPGQSIDIYTSNVNPLASIAIKLARNSFTSRYQITHRQSWQAGSNQSTNNTAPFGIEELVTTTVFTLPTNFDPKDWHNLHIPMLFGVRYVLPVFAANGTPIQSSLRSYGADRNFVDGVQIAEIDISISSQVIQFNSNQDLRLPTLRSIPNGGTWGGSSNTVDLFLDNIWVKDYGTGSFSFNRLSAFLGAAEIRINDFFQPIAVNGTNANNIQAEVFLRFRRNLLDTAPPAPTWNYTATGPILFGLPIGFDANLVSTASATAIPTYIINASATLNSSVVTATSAQRFRSTAVNLASDSALTCSPVKTVAAASNLNTTASVTGIISKVTRFGAQFNSDFAIDTDNVRARLFDISVQSTAQVSITPDLFKGIAADINSAAEFDIDSVRVRDSDTELQSIATQLTAVAKVGDFLLTFDAFTTVTATVQKTVDVDADIAAVFVHIVAPVKTVDVVVNMSAAASANIDSDRIKPVSAEFTATATLSADVAATLGLIETLTSTALLQIEPLRVRFAASAVNTTTALTCDNQIIKAAEADLSAVFTDLFVITRIQRIQAELTAFAFTLTAGRVINIDPIRQLRVPRESNQLRVTQETRIKRVQSETRILVI